MVFLVYRGIFVA